MEESQMYHLGRGEKGKYQSNVLLYEIQLNFVYTYQRYGDYHKFNGQLKYVRSPNNSSGFNIIILPLTRILTNRVKKDHQICNLKHE